jgi:helix-hairpin-helix protein
MPSSRPPGERAPEQPGDDLTRISGVGRVVAGRLAKAGIRTYEDVASSKPEELAAALVGLPACSASRIGAANWIGQARRLGGTPPATPEAPAEEGRPGPPVADAPEPVVDAPPILRIVRLGRVRITPVDRTSTTDQPTAVGLELRTGPGTAAAPTLDYSAAIAARRLDGDGEVPIVRLGGVVRVDRGVSHSAAGPPLDAGLYRLVATVEAHSTGHSSDDPPVWSEAASGDLLHVVAPRSATGARSGGPTKPHPAAKRLLASGMITEAEYAELHSAGPSS